MTNWERNYPRPRSGAATRGVTPRPRSGAAAGRSNPTSKEPWLRGRRGGQVDPVAACLLATLCGLWDLNSLTKDGTQDPSI